MKEFLRYIEWIDEKDKLDHKEILLDLTIGIIIPFIILLWFNK